MGTFRILALDGGGLLGTFTASVLERLEAQTGKRIVEHFDLITGTSTGGIIAIGLAMGVPAKTILDFYQNDGPGIFPHRNKLRSFARFFSTLFRPKFRPDPLRDAINRVLPGTHLREARTRLAVPAYEVSPGRVYVFKTPHNALRQQDADTRAADAALATSAAPTYFPAHTIPDHRGTFIDGGVWANGPTTVGIIEAVAFCGRRLDDLELLSIGTTTFPFRLSDRARTGGYLAWASQVIDTFMFGQSHGSVAAAESLLGGRFLRIDANTQPGQFRMDDPGAINELVRLGRVEAEKVSVLGAVQSRFLNGETITPWFATSPTPNASTTLATPALLPVSQPEPRTKPVLLPRPADLVPVPPIYRQRLVVYVVWHPEFEYGRVVADAIYAHLKHPTENVGGEAVGIPVLFRSTRWAGEALPDSIPFGEAHSTAVVVLVDDHLVGSRGWDGYVAQLWDDAQSVGITHRVYPVKMSANAFNLSSRISTINFIRPFDVFEGATADAGSEPAALTRLLNAVVHELCRLVLARPRAEYGYVVPSVLPQNQKLTIFLSHTKADGVPIAKAIKNYIESETHLKTFFDANDIDHGDEFDQVLMDRVGREDAALMVVHTDAYAGSVWCLEELLKAKEKRRPVLIVHALGTGEARGPVYVGNVPTRRYAPGACAQLVGRMLLEILRCEHFTRHFQDLKDLFGIDPAVEPLPYPPEPLTLADLKLAPSPATRFAYPEPPLSQGELKHLRALDDQFTFDTPLLLATRAKSGDGPGAAPLDPVPQLNGKTVGLSLGNSPDLSPAGMGDEHLNEAAVAFARYLLVCGADLVYGGIPRLDAPAGTAPPPNFLLLLLDLVRAYNRRAGGDEPRPRLRSYTPEAYSHQVDVEFLAKWKGAIEHETVPSGATPPVAGSDPVAGSVFTAQSLTAMRRRMAEKTDARVFLGGKSFGFAGKYPGLVEEAHVAMTKPQPVYLIGAFGGATRGVIDALVGNDNPVLSWTEQSRSPEYTALAGRYGSPDGGYPADRLGYKALLAFFRGVGVDGLSAPDGRNYNGLTADENRRLFVTPHVIEMVYLVLLGLGRVFGKKRG
jgi:SLOG cluster2/Patatin-like phospholipase/TIR domain